jgi:preprotein translocase subunit SecE
MAKTNPFQFVQQVRSEVAKVTWPTRRETVITTAMVFVMVFLAAILLLRGRPDPELGCRPASRHGRVRGNRLKMPKRWYIVHAYSNFENKVAESIREKAARPGWNTSSKTFWSRPKRLWRCGAAAR